MDRILRSSGGAVSVTLYDSSGAPANPPAGAISATVRDSAGAQIGGSPFPVTNPPATTGVLTFALPVVSALDVYDVTWTLPDASTRLTQFEIVGGYLFTIAQLRAFDSQLADATKYPATMIRDVREEITDRFEQVARVSFVPRGRRQVHSGDGSSTLILDDMAVSALVSVEIDGVALAAPELANVHADEIGVLVYDGGIFPRGIRNVRVLYEHGFRTTPGPVVRAGMKLAKHLLLDLHADRSERATAVITEVGGYRLSIAGRDGPTGIPDVDAVLAQFGKARPGFA